MSKNNPPFDFLTDLGRALAIFGRWLRYGSGPSAGERRAELERLRREWQKLELDFDEPLAARQAIIRADIILDKALSLNGYFGNTVGERLKRASQRLDRTVLDAAWRAHKIRNRLAHALDQVPTSAEINAAAKDYALALSYLGV